MPHITTDHLAMVVGWIAAGLSCFISAPQLVRILKAGTTSGVSILSWQLALGGNLTWGMYGITHGNLNQWLPNVALVTITLTILSLFHRHVGTPWIVLLAPGIIIGSTTTILDSTAGAVAYSVAAFLPAAVSLVSQLKVTATSVDVRGLSVGNQWIGLVNQSTWLLWALLIDERSVLMVGTASLILILANLSMALLRTTGTLGPVTRQGLRLGLSRA
ncbi:MAG TPA: PQ-loop repeat-containing protein [Propionibacteriaceae bacterium]|nr:PQ-loop repeat-containing protein [Propionibacteriaceae bacterium]